MSQNAPEKLSDRELLQLCREYGQKALIWRRRFAGLLPEVNRRGLYKQRGCSSIHEFAAKFAGFSREYTNRVLGTERNLEKAPLLREMLVRGEVSVNKLARVVCIATPKNQEELAEKVRLLPKAALETFVKDERCANGKKFVPGHENSLQLDEDVKGELGELQGRGIDVNALLRDFLAQRKLEIEAEKGEVVKAQGDVETKRYIPAAVRRVLRKEYGDRCAKPHCGRPAQNLHHTDRFGMSRSHDPHYMAPLCREHHVIAHSIDVKYHEARGRGG